MADRFEHIEDESDVEEILRMAIRDDAKLGSDLRARLSEAATELGISDEALAGAEAKWREERRQKSELNEFTAFRRAEAWTKVREYVLGAGACAGIDFFLNRAGLTWSLWVIVIWGVFVVPRALWFQFARTNPADEEFTKWRRKKRRRKSS